MNINISDPMKETGNQGDALLDAQERQSPRLPVVGVLAIQGDFDAHAAALREAGADPVLVRKPEQLDSIDGLIIPGGESTTFLKFLERDGFLSRLQSFV